MTYWRSFSSARDWVSGSWSSIGDLSFLPRGLCVTVSACNKCLLLVAGFWLSFSLLWLKRELAFTYAALRI